MKLRTLQRLWRIYRQKPHIHISESGQRTVKNHTINVGFHSRTGMCGALSFPATDSGNAQATSYAKTYAHITGFPVIDRRAVPEVGAGR